MYYRIVALILILISQEIAMYAQTGKTGGQHPKAELYYFHPTERCPIDQAIEETTRQIIQSDFSKQVREGVLKVRIINTDDKAMASIVERFDINAQAMYLVTWPAGKETKKDLTEFAFSNAKSNPVKFKSGLKEELVNAIK